MEIERSYIRAALNRQVKPAPVGSTQAQDSGLHRRGISSQNAELLLSEKQGGLRGTVIHFLFSHKETLKRIPLLGGILVRRKERMLDQAMESRVDCVDLSDCVGWYWEDFLPACYQRMLCRTPDPSGVAAYTQMARAGADNRVIAYAMSQSEEFSGKAVLLHSGEYRKVYRKFILRRRLKKIPILGRLVRLLALPGQVERLYGRLERTEQVMQAQYHETQSHLERQFQQTQQSLTELNRCLDQLHQLPTISEKLEWQADALQKAAQQMTQQVAVSTAVLTKLEEHITVSATAITKLDSQAVVSAAISEKLERQAKISTAISEKLDALPAFIHSQNTLSRTAVAGFPGGVIGVNVDDFLFGVPSDEWGLAMYLSTYGHFEPGSEFFFESLLRPGMTVADLGANLGIYTLRALRAGCRVFSYEPTPETFRLLQQNIKANGFAESGRVFPVQAAVSDHCGSAEFFRKPGICGQNSLYQEADSGEGFPVELLTLDSQREALGSVDVIKLDVEGAEYAALCGMEAVLQENVGVQILMEFAPSHIRRAGHEPSELLALVRRHGFSLYLIDEATAGVKPVTEEELQGVYSVNLYLKREGDQQ